MAKTAPPRATVQLHDATALFSRMRTGDTILQLQAAIAPGIQRLPFGTLEARIPAPATAARTVALRMEGNKAVQLVVAPIQPAGKEQRRDFTPTQREVTLTVPPSPDGAVMRWELRCGKATETLYLLAPAPHRRRERVTLTVKNQLAYRPLLTLASDAGIYLLCPGKLATQRLTVSVTDQPPLTALHDLLQRQHYQLDVNGATGNITKTE